MIKVFPSPAYNRMVVDFLKRFPEYKNKLIKAIELLKKDPFYPTLKTHKLHGPLKEFYACRVTYDQRIIFLLDNDSITLVALGSHDKLY